MRNLAFALALGSTALAGPALAKNGTWYLGVDAGALLVEDSNFDLRNSAGNVFDNQLKINHEIGFDADGVIGYDFGGFRAEFEVAYKDANLESVEVLTGGVPLRLSRGNIGVPAVGINEAADGNARVLSFMANGLIDFGGENREIGGYIGAGVGVARVKMSQYQLAKFGNTFVSDSDTGVAWQALAGIRKPLSDYVEIGLKYRYFNAPKVDAFTVNGFAFDTRFRSHSLMASLIYNFYVPPPPPPPVMAPPAPVAAPLPPCPPAAVSPGPFLVFFDWDRSVITAEAAAILDRAAEQYAATGQTSVALAGHADKSGKDDYNVALSQRRADAVKAYMVGKGIPDGVIGTEAFGESRPLVDTADGVREPQNRRVEITFTGAAAAPSYPCTPQ